MHSFLSLLNYFKFSRTLNWTFTCSGPSDSRSRQTHLPFFVPITRLCYCADKNKESLISNTISKLRVFLTCFPKSLNVHYIHQRKLPFSNSFSPMWVLWSLTRQDLLQGFSQTSAFSISSLCGLFRHAKLEYLTKVLLAHKAQIKKSSFICFSAQRIIWPQRTLPMYNC